MKNNLIVLGIHFGHNCGAALVHNGKVIAAINEERIRNVKHLSGSPIKSIEEVFKISNMTPEEVDIIAIAGSTTTEFTIHDNNSTKFLNWFFNWSWMKKNQTGLKKLEFYRNRFNKINELRKKIPKLIPQKEIIYVEHHLSHAASAYYLSPWDLEQDVLIFTADGYGDGISSTVSIGKKGIIERMENSETSYFDSLGTAFYAQIAIFLGMKSGLESNKVMGLAPYGNYKKSITNIQKMMALDHHKPLKFSNSMGLYRQNMQLALQEKLAGHRFDDIASATQNLFENLITKWIKNTINKTNIRKIACAGGNFQNVKANKKILEMDDVDDAFFCPAAGDDGLAVGAALAGYYEIMSKDGRKISKNSLDNVYFGTNFSNEQIKESLKKTEQFANAEFIEDIDVVLGEILSKSKIVGRFNGRMEWGPRALGNRSILADPSNENVVRKLNKAIKMRDFWMPFGASILSERIDDYLVEARNAPYMILAFDTTENRDEISAAIHPFDLTCRPQTVDNVHNESYRNVLKSFENKTGIGAVLNTSLNLHGFPTVFSPDIAIDTFKNSALDYLAIGNYLIKK